MGRIQRSMCAGMLGLQSVVLFLVGLLLPSATDLGFGAGIGIGLGLGALCVLAAGLMRTPVGGWLGWGIQAASIALGFVVTAMFALGVIFLALYAGSWFLGARIDQEKAERATAHAGPLD